MILLIWSIIAGRLYHLSHQEVHEVSKIVEFGGIESKMVVIRHCKKGGKEICLMSIGL